MNGPGDLPLQHYSPPPDTNNCSITSIIPTLGMSSCRGRAEAFARRLSSKLKTLGSQADESDNSQEEEPIINGTNTLNNTWVSNTGPESEQTVTALQPLRHESDSFFDFDCELESPGSPVDECEYLRLIESTSNTPHNSAPESGYACASAASSHSSTDGPYFDVNSENESTQQQQQPHHNQKKESRKTQPTLSEQDEVDFARPLPSIKDQICNGHKGIMIVKETLPLSSTSTQSSEPQQPISNNVTKSLPSEGPDIKETKTKLQKPEPLIKQNNRAPSLQDQILSELLSHSQEKTDEELEAEEYKNAAALAENKKNTCKVIHNLINGQAENGEEVLKIEVCEVESVKVVEAVEAVEKVKLVEAVAAVEKLETVAQEEPKKEEPTTAEDLKDVLCEIKKEIEAEEPKTEVEESSSKDKSEAKTHPNMHHDTTDDEEDCRPQRVRRCSSLKTGKTPPGTPGRKKIVRFADVLGLDLADIKTFLDEIPNIPKSAYEDLEILESEPPLQLGPKSDRLLMPLFQQPGGLPNFLDTVRAKQVSLENAAVTDTINNTITGSVRVRNLDFHKSVHIRYSLDSWRSFADLKGNYVENSCDGFSDKFTFVLFGNSLHIGQRLEFAVRFQCKGQQYWDNNYGSNYCFQCLPTSSANPPAVQVIPSHHANNMAGMLSPTVGEAWCSSFY